MSLKFTSGDIEKLKKLITPTIPDDWKEINNNTYQVKFNGVSVSFFVSTGTIQFQGNPEKTNHYEVLVGKLLSGEKVEVSADLVDQPKLAEVVEEKKFLSQKYEDSEIVIGLVGAIGTQYQTVKDILRQRLEMIFKYEVEDIKISKAIIEKLPNFNPPETVGSESYERINNLMNAGNNIRKSSKNNAILALGAASYIHEHRTDRGTLRKAYIIESLKHPDEIKALREIYGQGFYLIGVYSDINHRTRYLTKELNMSDEEANKLISKDENDADGGHGQHTSDTYHLSDFYADVNYNSEKLKQSIFRFLDIVFGSPHLTPLFEEYSMFMAFTASLRSADLSRQVGAVLTKDEDIIATGANDIPKYGGGLYWPYYDEKENEFVDFPHGRDYTRGFDSNVIERKKIINEIVEKAKNKGIDSEHLEGILESSRLKDLIEFGRVVHAEMETLMTCARNAISARNSVMFCTTFPCHNCAKHIIAAGVDKVYFIEPYPKSKALEFHSDSIKTGIPDDKDEKQKFTFFEPFIGVGPRKFFDLFSINSGSGRTIKRKDKDGNIVDWNRSVAKPKVQLFPISYLHREGESASSYNDLIVR
jgi:deoxycytidylate deaminase